MHYFNLLIIFILTTSLGQAQGFLKIEYEQIKDFPGISTSKVHSSYLQSGVHSLYSEFWGEETEEMRNEQGELTVSVGGKTLHTFKNYEKNTIYFPSTISLRSILTQDDINTMEWTLQEETEEILGYNCQLAVSEFRGRTYYAFFTDKLGFNGGPWKFDGLPGMILKVKSQDGVFSITAKSIELKKEETEIPNPYEDLDKIITYEEFKELYNKRYKEVNRTEVFEDGRTLTRSMPKCQIECFVE